MTSLLVSISSELGLLESFENCNNVHILELMYEFITKDIDLRRAF